MAKKSWENFFCLFEHFYVLSLLLSLCNDSTILLLKCFKKHFKHSFKKSNDYIYFINHEKRQLIEFLKTYPCIIYVKIALNVNFKSLHSNKTKNSSALTLKFNKWKQYFTTKRCFKQFYKGNVFLKRYCKNCLRSVTCYS